MHWTYIALAITSFINVIAVAAATKSRRVADKRKHRVKVLRTRLEAAEIAARLIPDKSVPGAYGKQRYERTPIVPFAVATGGRSKWQADHPDLLPPVDCDLSDFGEPVARPTGDAPESVAPHDIRTQHRRLQREFRGQHGLVHLNALTIAYLRRNTEHTAKARTLFFRIWAERADSLAPLLSPRWLLSTLRTFDEHGQTENQRLIGVGGSLYGYMQRIYESERAMTGATPDENYALDKVAEGAFGFPGLVPTSATVNDSTSHIHALLIDLSLRDDGAGRVLEELLIRSYHAPNIFTRADQNRARLLGSDGDAQSAHWSFHHSREQSRTES